MPSALSHFTGSYEPISLSEHAYMVIRDRILKGELKLGAPLSRRKLAAELNMSLLPLSEALQRLESEGLVESRPRVGTRVCQPTAEDIRERYEVREALEAQAARLFAEKSSARERGELKEMAERMDEMFSRCFDSRTRNPETLYDVHSFHTRFHLRIAECTGCRLLCEALEKNHVMIFNWVYDVAAERPPLPSHFHRELMAALCSNDPEAADRAMRHHVRFGLDNVLRGIRPAGSEPPRPEVLLGGNASKRISR
jgi:DNA-binding GntR family transcriptional regulator